MLYNMLLRRRHKFKKIIIKSTTLNGKCAIPLNNLKLGIQIFAQNISPFIKENVHSMSANKENKR